MLIKKNKLVFLVLIVVVFSLIFAGCEKEPEKVNVTGFDINAKKILISEKDGNLMLDLKIQPADVYPLDIDFKSSNEEVATATLGAIDENGKAVTASELQAKKDKLEEENKEEADKIIVPTNTAIVTAHGYGECTITGTLSSFSKDIDVTVADKQVALTFDDGSAKTTLPLLDGLKKENAKATFFIVGEMTKRDNDHINALKQAISDGHEIGNHTYNHNGASATIDTELKKTDKLIESLGGEKTKLMRPPGGLITSGMEKSDKAIIIWSLDTQDWRSRNAQSVYKNIMDAKDGDIILMHDLYDTSVEGTLEAIPELREKGFIFVTVSELLGDLKPNKEYRKGEKGKLKTQILE